MFDVARRPVSVARWPLWMMAMVQSAMVISTVAAHPSNLLRIRVWKDGVLHGCAGRAGARRHARHARWVCFRRQRLPWRQGDDANRLTFTSGRVGARIMRVVASECHVH